MNEPRNQQEAERLRWLQTDQALQALRQDMQLRSVSFTWKRESGTATSPSKLVAFLNGAAPRPYEHAALALTLLRPLFLHAVIENGDVEPGHSIDFTDAGDDSALNMPSRRWFVVLWLDCPAAEALRREGSHEGLDSHMHRVDDGEINRTLPTGSRCPHDGSKCHYHCFDDGAPRACRRERNGWNLSNPWDGFPLQGHAYPAKGLPMEER